MFFVCSLLSPASLKSEFYPPHLFSLLVVPFIHLKVKEQFKDNPDLLVSPRALASSLIQGTHPLNYYSDQEFESYINKSNLDWLVISLLNLINTIRSNIEINPNPQWYIP